MPSIHSFQGAMQDLTGKTTDKSPFSEHALPVTAGDEVPPRALNIRRHTSSATIHLSPQAADAMSPYEAMGRRSVSATATPGLPPRDPIVAGQAFVESFNNMHELGALPPEYEVVVARHLLTVADHAEGLKVIYGEKDGALFFGAAHDMLTDPNKPMEHGEMLGCVAKGLRKMPGKHAAGLEIFRNQMRPPGERTLCIGGARMRVERDEAGTITQVYVSASSGLLNEGGEACQIAVAQFYLNVLELGGVAQGVPIGLDPTNMVGKAGYLRDLMSALRA